ncbi:MAG: helix-turn-helix transcriptional regulator [Gemmatimonadaceae bacterium]
MSLLHPQASPDGRFLAATRLRWTKTLRRLELTGAGAGTRTSVARTPAGFQAASFTAGRPRCGAWEIPCAPVGVRISTVVVFLQERTWAHPNQTCCWGTLDLLILKTLTLEPMHGWGISQRIQSHLRGVLDVNQGSLYLALQRLENCGWIDSSWRTSDNNRRAKYFIA